MKLRPTRKRADADRCVTQRSRAHGAQTMDEQVRELRQEADGPRPSSMLRKRELMEDHPATPRADLALGVARGADRVRRRPSRALRSRFRSQDVQRLRARARRRRVRETAEELKTRRDDAPDVESQAADSSVQALQSRKLRPRAASRDEIQPQRSPRFVRACSSLEELAAAHEGFGDGPQGRARMGAHERQASSSSRSPTLSKSAPSYETALEGWLENRLEEPHLRQSVARAGRDRACRGEKQGRVAIHVAARPRPTMHGAWRRRSSSARSNEAGIPGRGQADRPDRRSTLRSRPRPERSPR